MTGNPIAALALSGTVFTIDAMGCQKIVAKKADYILAVKENQGQRLEEIKDSFQMPPTAEQTDCERASRAPPLLGDRRPIGGREGRGTGVVTGFGAHRGRALPPASSPRPSG